LLPSLSALEVAHRKLVAEIMMVRLFLALENTIAAVSAKMLTGAPYLDGTSPQRLVTVGTTGRAAEQMREFNRAQSRRLRWTQSSDIRKNLEFTLAGADPYFATVARHGAILTEMRYVRNQIAHGNSSTRDNFRKVVRQHYGGLKKGVTAGLILLTDALGPPSLLERYIITSRVMIKELVRA